MISGPRKVLNLYHLSMHKEPIILKVSKHSVFSVLQLDIKMHAFGSQHFSFILFPLEPGSVGSPVLKVFKQNTSGESKITLEPVLCNKDIPKTIFITVNQIHYYSI